MTFNAAKAAQHPIVMISGDEEILRRRALQALFEAIEMTPEDFEVESFAGDSARPADWVASAGTAPFMAPRRVALVRHLLRAEPDREALAGVPPTGLVILVADDEGGDESKQQRLRTVRTNWGKAVEGAGGFVAKFDPDPKGLKDEIRRAAAAAGKPMAPAAAEAIAEMTGGSLTRALDEVEKLILYVGEAEAIREADVRAVVVPSREWNVFKMTDAIAGGDVPAALRQLRDLVGSAQKAEDAAFSRVLPMLNRQLRLLWQARVCVDAGCLPSNAPESVRAAFPAKPNLGSESGYRQQALISSARKVDARILARCMRIASDTDARLKGALDGFTGMDTLERMVLEMAEAVKGER
jgi:DNA polymerase III subunit delta